MSVAIHHVTFEATSLGGIGAEWAAAVRRAMPWEAGVDVFFVISGFVMLHASESLFANGWSGVRRFLAQRVARIVPLYWFVTGAFLIVAVIDPGATSGGNGGPWAILASLGFIPFARPGGLVQPVFGLGWTLNYEMEFYALFAAALWMPRLWAILCISGTLCGLAAANVLTGFTSTAARFWADPIVLEFLFGVWIRMLLPVVITMPGRARLGLIVGVLLIWYRHSVDAGLPRPIAWGLPAAALVAATVRTGIAPVSRWTYWGGRIGDASYALYLLHPFVMRAASQIWRRAAPATPGVAMLFIVTTLALSCSLALMVNVWAERHVTRLVRAWLIGGRS